MRSVATTPTTGPGSGTTRLRPWIAPVVDLGVVLLFVAIGRRSHNEANDASGFLTTLWPFVAGLAVGALVTRLYTAPLEWRRGRSRRGC